MHKNCGASTYLSLQEWGCHHFQTKIYFVQCSEIVKALYGLLLSLFWHSAFTMQNEERRHCVPNSALCTGQILTFVSSKKPPLSLSRSASVWMFSFDMLYFNRWFKIFLWHWETGITLSSDVLPFPHILLDMGSLKEQGRSILLSILKKNKKRI